MSHHATTASDAPPETDRLIRLVRWTCASGSNIQSRGSVVIESGDHRWQASAVGNGPVDALFRAVGEALHDVLSGLPRLLAYDVHAVAEGPDAEGRVTVRLAPPAGGEGARAEGSYEASVQRANIIAASVEAYVDALDHLLGEAHWQGATESAGNKRAAPVEPGPGVEFDPDAPDDDVRLWFDR
ncbi:MAG: alpha-isopropylmalate synthase regulatory domain-containing protein [Candidatus Limnocylindrales bacterium]